MKRSRMKASTFALRKERKYPLNNLGRARNAIVRARTFATPKQRRRIYNAIIRKYPALAKRSKVIQTYRRRKRK